MTQQDAAPLLYHVVATGAVTNGCMAVEVQRAGAKGAPRRTVSICGEDEMLVTRGAATAHGFIGLAWHRNTPDLSPATVALELKILDQNPDTDWSVLALPRPMPISVPKSRDDVKTAVLAAVRGGGGMVFTLSPQSVVVDALPIDRSRAQQLLGMVAR